MEKNEIVWKMTHNEHFANGTKMAVYRVSKKGLPLVTGKELKILPYDKKYDDCLIEE